jgi:streptogramin lyase
MNQRLRPRKSVAAILRWMDGRAGDSRFRLNRPTVECLESRRLLATVAEFPVPSGTGAAPSGMATGPGGSVWFTEFGADKIGTIDPSTHAISEFSIPTPNAQPFRIALGPDGNLWFTEFGANQIGMINPATDKITEFPLPTANASPFGITAGPNNTVWFTEWSGNQIGTINLASGKVTEYSIPALNAVPEGITLGPDGNIWFTESQGNSIAMFDTTNHTFAEHPLPTADAQPYGITTGPGGDLWFTEYTGNQIGTYSVSSSSFSSFFNIPTSNTQPTEITAAPDGNVWFTQSHTNQVAMLNPRLMNPTNQNITEYATPTSVSGPRGITGTSDGSIWFAEVNSGKVATIAASTHIVVTSSPPQNLKLGQTFSLTVAVEFDSGAVDTDYSGNVNLSLSSGGGVGVLLGKTTVAAANGIASFNGLSLVAPGGFAFQVKAGTSTPATVGPINVTGPVGVLSPTPSTTPAPTVLGEKLVMAGKGSNQHVAGIVLTFSSPLDPATAQNAANYSVLQMSKNGRTKAAKALRVRAVYNPASKTVRLTFAAKPRFTAGGQLLVVGSSPKGIAGSSGTHLEGNMGTNAVYTILPNARGIGAP